jgi:hypothetical protein
MKTNKIIIAILIMTIVIALSMHKQSERFDNKQSNDEQHTITYDNLMTHCINDDYGENVFYINNGVMTHHLTTVAFKNDKIYSLSSDWLSIISFYYKKMSNHYHPIVETINQSYELIKNKKYKYINEDVVLFINTFSNGTGHGYTGIIVQLMYYYDNIHKYNNKKILMYDNTQKGIKDIIYFFIKEEDIIMIREKELYQFKSIAFIPIKNHAYNFDYTNNTGDKYSGMQIYQFVEKNIIKSEKNIYKEKVQPEYVYILKTSAEKNNSSGSTETEINNGILNVIEKQNMVNVSPNAINNEIELINILNKCKVFVCSYGTAFEKNFIYLSDTCKLIVVIYNDSCLDIINGYYNNCHWTPECKNITPKKYKNAEIKYVLYNDENNNQINSSLFDFINL